MLEQLYRQLEQLRDHPDPDEQVYRDAAAILNAACDHARKLGIEGTVKHAAIITPVDAMEIVGRLIQKPEAYTVASVASRFQVGDAKVLGWIKRGELQAVNVASNQLGRPRYVITQEQLQEFEKSRTAVVVPTRRRRRK